MSDHVNIGRENMQELIKPPVPPGADVRKFPYMPLQGARLVNSEFTWSVSDAEFRAAVLLWIACWHQVPASSLPNNDALLAGIAGCGRGPKGVEEWKQIKAGALYGFKPATDGRLYHPVIAEMVLDALRKLNDGEQRREQRREQIRRSTAGWRAKKKQGLNNGGEHGEQPVNTLKGIEGKGIEGKKGSEVGDTPERKITTHASPAAPGDGGCVSGDAGAQGGTGELFPDQPPTPAPKSKRSPKAAYPAAFEKFWAPYPRKVGKDAAHKAWTGAVKRAEPDAITKGAELFAALVKARGTPDDKIPHPSTWLNAGRWQDEDLNSATGAPGVVPVSERPGNKMVFGKSQK